VLTHVPVLIVTRGAEGSTIALRGGQPEALAGTTTFRVPPARLRGPAVDPTGVGDAFRGGLLAALHHGMPWEVAARVGSVAAVYTLEALGPQPPRYTIADFIARYGENFGFEGPHARVSDLAPR
jgi:adenosine kinase